MSTLAQLAVYDTMLRPHTSTEIAQSAPKDIARSSAPKNRRSPSFLFDSPPSAPLAPATSNATAVSTSKPTKSKRDPLLSSPTSPRKSFFPVASKSSFSSANSGASGGFAGGIFSLSSLLAKMPSSASIAPILSSTSLQHSNNNNSTSKSSKMASGSNIKDKPAVSAGMTTAEKHEAIRSAQALIASVRNDWEWTEEMRKNKRRKTDESTIPSLTGSTTLMSEDDSEDEDDREYRSRYESDTDDDSKYLSSASGKNAKSAKSVDVYPDDDPKSAYRFHGPDTIGTSPTREDRKVRRKKELEEEMKWNDGLRIWVERRDLWTQANKEGKVPIGQSKFQENPFYDAVVPDAYPQLYQRIIVKGNTPTIPINLQHMTNAMVEGWKADGQWPPKPSKPEPAFSRKKTISVGESMVKRVFGIGR